MTSTYVRSLEVLGRSDLPLAGGKGANLGALASAGFPVPPGFCVTTEAYRAFVAANGLEPTIARLAEQAGAGDPAALEAASAQIRAAFAAAALAPEMATEIRAAYAALASSHGEPLAVAVRSSATAEDLPDLSFAGQQDTYLNVVGDEALLAAIVRCWSSLWTARAMGYRARNDLAQTMPAIAVVVQQMVPSESSGVLFTANPVTGRRTEIVIDATLGLGEALVSGQVEPDHYVIDAPAGRIVTKTLGAKALSIRGQSSGGTTTIAEDAAARQALPDEQILKLARLGQRAAEFYGAPQDVEWAWAGGRLYLVQSRPITSLYPLPAEMPGDGRGPVQILFSFGSMQGMLDPFTPFGQDVFRHIGAGLDRLFGGAAAPETQSAMLVAGERLYINVSCLARHPAGRRVLEVFMASIDPVSGEALVPLLEGARREGADGRIGLRGVLRTARVMAPVAGTVAFNLAFPVRGRARLQRRIDAALHATEARGASGRTLAERVLWLQDTLLRVAPPMLLSLVPCVASGQAPLQWLARMVADLPGGTQDALELSRGQPHNVTTEMDLALWAAACEIKADAAAAAHFARADPATLAAEYLAGTLPAAAQQALARFLRAYGMRGIGEIDMGRPRWREDPSPLMQAVRSYLDIDEARSPAAVFASGAGRAEAARDRLVSALRKTRNGRFKAAAARWIVGRARELGGLRESPKFAAIRMMGLLRAALLDSGRDLAARGVLDRAEDLFFLRVAEIDALARGERRDWRALVAARRQAYAREARRRRVPRLLLADGTAVYESASAAEPGGEAITGSPVSPGTVDGRVRVVLDPRGARLEPGEILVCPATDPAWTPLFLAAGGLVMEVGGMMTHGSVVAREYGIPAVVGVSRATTRLRTGQHVRVDGSTGRITVLEAAGA